MDIKFFLILLSFILSFFSVQSQTYYDVYPENVLTIKPVIIGEDRLIFNEIAAKMGLEGIVTASTIIDSNGCIIRCDIIKNSHHIFDTVAVNTIKKLQFSPPVYQNKFVQTYISISAQFWQTEKRKEQYKNIRSQLDTIDSLIEDNQYTKAFRFCESLYTEIDEFKKGQKNLAWSYELKNDKFGSYSANWSSYLFDEELALSLVNMGIIYYKIKKFDQSEKYLKAALTYAPYLENVYGELGWLYFLKGQYEKCIEYCNKAITTYPNINYKCCKALAYLVSENFNESLNQFEQCHQYCNKFDLKIPENILKQLNDLHQLDQYKLNVEKILNIISG